jgi:hypothetical protein
MNILKNIQQLISKILVIFTLSAFCSCEPDIHDGIPYVFVEIDINLNNTSYLDLQRDGGFVYVMGGVKGIIIYRKNPTTYLAFEQNSPVNPSAACAIVEVDESQLFIIDHCSQAIFDFEGNPSNGISRFPLKQYITILDNNWLYIRSE